MVSAILIISIVVAVLAAALGGAFMSGMLNPLIEQIGFYLFKAKAKAEKKKLQAMGMKEGRDFVESKFNFSVLSSRAPLQHSILLPFT
jgi:hypothetical protein